MSVLIMCVLTMGLFVSLPVSAQNDRSHVRHGNKFYQKKDFEHAETSYSKAIEKNDKNPQAHYNLGNALLAQRKDSAAVVAYEKSCKLETNPTRKSMAYHNLGVVCQQHKMYGEAIENYKQCLRLNPRDDEARYNLELCKRQKQNQDKDKQNQQQQQQQQQQQNQQQDQQQDKQQEKKQEQQKPQMSKENAEQLLNAAMQQEKQTQKRMNEAQKQGDRRRNEKNW